MKLTFESNLPYQREAVKAVVRLFEGQPQGDSEYHYEMLEKNKELSFIDGIGNRLALSQEQMLANLQKVQQQNGVAISEVLDNMHFSIEMETGTGKTYVYLRTIYELNLQYGFKKFVIVVPSVPIREGVLKNLQITHEHFQTLYDNVPVNYKVYDRSHISQLRGFATSDNIEILVINIDAFSKDENVINKPNENGQEPIKFIQTIQPIVIVDEPQNMDSTKRSAAIANLNPLCTLRYSATHRNRYNLVYSLNPVKAYDMGLVKQIEVDSVLEENTLNGAFVELNSIVTTKTKITAKITIDVNDKDGVKRKTVNAKVGDDLYTLSNNREIYRDGYIIEGIDASNGYIAFSNNDMIYQGERHGAQNDEIMKFQIRRTIEEHLSKELKLSKQGIKVLSLFFIDRVANYRSFDEYGNTIKGKFYIWFEEIYKELIAKPIYQSLDKYPVEKLHNGYFSQDKKGLLKDTSGDTQADADTYNLIMRDKEELLDIDNPLRFIFSHTALREGWDNPNVFQICTLNETKSEMKKRQEIGRGLRLAVDKNGIRIYDKNINRLTVVANEAYNDFAKALQTELQEDCGIDFGKRIKSKKDRVVIKYRKGFEADPLFLSIWEKLKTRTTYRVKYDTEDLVRKAGDEIKNMPKIESSSVRSVKNEIVIGADGITAQYKSDRVTTLQSDHFIPNILGYIQRYTELTRSTIMRILIESGRINDLAVNPQLFMERAVEAIRRVLQDMMIDGIEYRKLGNSTYEMRLFEDDETYRSEDTFEVSKKEKTIYDSFMPLDSTIENQFAQDCESSEQVKFYFKLPRWFRIPTPIGNYNPDWAVIFENDKRIYFIAETKDTGTIKIDITKLRSEEQAKIKCGEAHFRQFVNLEYRVVKKVSELIE